MLYDYDHAVQDGGQAGAEVSLLQVLGGGDGAGAG